ncbi:hypothetical protein F4861DRAFT_201895 [Xylaria intraflava]|nr:hypothetical protein F4861DRAFT_201895 [Xylaria intraflava]
MSTIPETGILRRHYEDAVGDIEHKSSAFWQAFLQRAFFETEVYSVTSESSPDNSRRKADIVVKRYDIAQQPISTFLWVECKRPNSTTSLREAERQALDAAMRCIKADGLKYIYAVTTVGVSFRTWLVTYQHQHLEPLHGTNAEADRRQYIGTDMADAWVLTQTIQSTKDCVILRRATTTPNRSFQSQSWTYYGGEAEQEGLVSTRSSYYGGETEPDFEVEQTSASSRRHISLVEVQRISHTWGADKYVFRDSKGHRKSTERNDWERLDLDGGRVWVFHGKKTTYIARKLG